MNRISVSRTYCEALLQRFVEFRPNWIQFVETDEESIRIVFPSEHPTISTPLTILLKTHCELYWHEGYFCDFINDDKCFGAIEFLEGFFGEEIDCVVCWHGGKVTSGGPSIGNEWQSWEPKFEKLELRSWRGSDDLDYVPHGAGLHRIEYGLHP